MKFLSLVISIFFAFIILLGISTKSQAAVQLPADKAPSNLEAKSAASLLDIQKIIADLISPFLEVATGVAIFFIVLGGFLWVTAMGRQEQLDKAKKTLTWAIIGFLIIIFSYLIVQIITRIFYEGVPTKTQAQQQQETPQ